MVRLRILGITRYLGLYLEGLSADVHSYGWLVVTRELPLYKSREDGGLAHPGLSEQDRLVLDCIIFEETL